MEDVELALGYRSRVKNNSKNMHGDRNATMLLEDMNARGKIGYTLQDDGRTDNR